MRSRAWAGDWPITQDFGCTDVTLEPAWPACPSGHFHPGADIGMPIGTELYAERPGRVSVVAYGLLGLEVAGDSSGVLDEHDWYVHIDRAVVGIGTYVEAGVLIAYSGNKVPGGGASTGPHLHFEVQTGRLNDPGTARDPIAVLNSPLEDEEMDNATALRLIDSIDHLNDTIASLGKSALAEANEIGRRIPYALRTGKPVPTIGANGKPLPDDGNGPIPGSAEFAS